MLSNFNCSFPLKVCVQLTFHPDGVVRIFYPGADHSKLNGDQAIQCIIC